MKYLIRYLSVLLCCLLLLVAFSISASAEEVETKPLQITQESYLIYGSAYSIGTFTFYPNNNEHEIENPVLKDGSVGTMITLSSGFKIRNVYQVINSDTSNILNKGKTYNVKLSNFYFSTLVEDRQGMFYANDIQEMSVVAVASDGTEYNIGNLSTNQETGDFIGFNNYYDLSFDITPEKDIKKFIIVVNTKTYRVVNSGSNYVVPIGSYLGEWNDDNKYTFSLEVESQEAGLLKGLLGKITELWNTTKDGFSNLTNGITNVFNSILELPQKIWTFIENGLKNLFVPDEEYMTSYRDKWDELLSQRFGAIYQVGDIVVDFVGNIRESDATNTIEFPEVSYSFSGAPFVFGGYDVKIVPDGFGFLADICKLITSVVCTLLFINGLRKKYDEVMGVPNNDN